MGMALGGLLPCMAAVIRHSVPERFVGSAMGWSLSAQFAGQVIGPVIGGSSVASSGCAAFSW